MSTTTLNAPPSHEALSSTHLVETRTTQASVNSLENYEALDLKDLARYDNQAASVFETIPQNEQSPEHEAQLKHAEEILNKAFHPELQNTNELLEKESEKPDQHGAREEASQALENTYQGEELLASNATSSGLAPEQYIPYLEGYLKEKPELVNIEQAQVNAAAEYAEVVDTLYGPVREETLKTIISQINEPEAELHAEAQIKPQVESITEPLQHTKSPEEIEEITGKPLKTESGVDIENTSLTDHLQELRTSHPEIPEEVFAQAKEIAVGTLEADAILQEQEEPEQTEDRRKLTLESKETPREMVYILDSDQNPSVQIGFHQAELARLIGLWLAETSLKDASGSSDDRLVTEKLGDDERDVNNSASFSYDGDLDNESLLAAIAETNTQLTTSKLLEGNQTNLENFALLASELQGAKVDLNGQDRWNEYTSIKVEVKGGIRLITIETKNNQDYYPTERKLDAEFTME